jgi:hypothetical protein
MALKQFDVTIKDKPGEIAAIADIIAKSNVNIRGVSTEKREKNAVLHIISEDDAATKKALKGSKVKFDERTVLLITLPNKPGELAKVTKNLAAEKINIESLLVLSGSETGTNEIVIGVDNEEAAKKVLGAAA